MIEIVNGYVDIGIVWLLVLWCDVCVCFVELVVECLCVVVFVDYVFVGCKCIVIVWLWWELFVLVVYCEWGGFVCVVIDLCLKWGFVLVVVWIVLLKMLMLNFVVVGWGVVIVLVWMVSVGIDGVVFVLIFDEDVKLVCVLVLLVELMVLV